MNMLATRFASGRTRIVNNMGKMDTADHALTEEELRSFVPSIFAPAPHASRSERYGYIPTIEVVRGLEREGFRPVFACEAHARAEDRHGFTKHMIRFRQNAVSVPPSARVHLGGIPELVMVNSHDGSTSYQLLAGFFRTVCANGMVCGDGFEELRVQHKGDVVREVIGSAYLIVATFTRAITNAEHMRSVELRPDERLAFAEGALALKYYDENAGKVDAPITVDQVIEARRVEDNGHDLWTTFNVAQENLIRGGLRGQRVDANNRRRRMTTRAVNGIDGNVKLNRALWTMAEKMAGLVGKPVPAA